MKKTLHYPFTIFNEKVHIFNSLFIYFFNQENFNHSVQNAYIVQVINPSFIF